MGKIVIFGNCQVSSIAGLMRFLLPDWNIRSYLMRDVLSAEPADVEAQLKSADFILAHPMSRADIGAFRRENLETLPNTHFFPSFVFSGFHPDCVYVSRHTKPTPLSLQSPVGDYHSAIAVFAHRLGLDLQTTLDLYCDNTYEQLGYYNLFDRECARVRQEFSSFGFDVDDKLKDWRRAGRFMHTINHPHSFVLADIVEVLAQKLDLPVPDIDISSMLRDNGPGDIVWPVYPELAAHLGVRGGTYIKAKDGVFNKTGRVLLKLEDFVEQSLQRYQEVSEDLSCISFAKTFDESVAIIDDIVKTGGKKRSRSNPYSTLPDSAFWKRSIAQVDPDQVDPVVAADWTIEPSMGVATAGSCFAQHIARHLQANDFNYLVTEKPEDGMSKEDAVKGNYGVFTARYGNLYTARQLLQLLQFAYGHEQIQVEAWERRDGRFIDPFRPQIEPNGFACLADLRSARDTMFGSVRKMVETADVFVFTLGLTESWMNQNDGTVVPLHPQVVDAPMDEGTYGFKNFDVNEVTEDMRAAIKLMLSHNPKLRIILTVSPVPLIATYSTTKHVLTSTTYSKSVLRVAAEAMEQAFDKVTYFPSYEIITGNFNRGAYFAEDLRSVREVGVNHVMRLFFKHYCNKKTSGSGVDTDAQRRGAEASASEMMQNVVCDEEQIEASVSA